MSKQTDPRHLFAVADAARLPFADRSVDLVFGSPPYCDARTYGIGAQRGAREWVDWMLDVTAEALRVSRGFVIWVCAGVTRDHTYWPACEGLLWEWQQRGGSCFRPAYWYRVGVPGSGGDYWLRADVEYVLCFKRPGRPDFWTDNTACGEPPKHKPGGEFSNRKRDGKRHTKRMKRESGFETQYYVPPDIVNPGNLIDIPVGCGRLGHPLAHENEAPFPQALAEFFVKSFCPPGGTVLDPFSGSGTTVAAADALGRCGVGTDIRQSQCELGRRRVERPHAPVPRKQDEEAAMPLFGGMA